MSRGERREREKHRTEVEVRTTGRKEHRKCQRRSRGGGERDGKDDGNGGSVLLVCFPYALVSS